MNGATLALKRAAVNCARAPGRAVNRRLLPAIEQLTLRAAGDAVPQRPVFIVGPPRSGSTLLMQLIARALDVGYVSNRHCAWHGSLALVEKMSRRSRSFDFRSRFGATTGADAPAECADWWYRFFPRDPAYVDAASADPQRMLAFRRAVGAFALACGKPVVFKNLFASLRIRAIAEYLPEALFIVIRRAEEDNAHSILAGRYKVQGNYDDWWSVPTHETDSLRGAAPEVQAVEQVRGVLQIIEQDLSACGLPPTQSIGVDYETLCATPHDTLRDVANFLDANGAAAALDLEGIPARFERRKTIRINSGLHQRLNDYVQRTAS